MLNKAKTTKDDKKMFREIFWNSFFLESSYNYERQQGLGFAIGMWPAIKRFYKTKAERADALVRHLSIFNTTPHVVTAITGVAAALEKQASENEDFDKSTINSVKVGLMGPLAGIGDSFFWGTLRIIATGIGLPLAAQGNILGPILFLLVFNIPHLLVRYYGGVLGYKFGTNLLNKASDSGIMNILTKAATIVGLMVIGAMSASMVKLETPLKFMISGKEFLLQDYINQIFPLLLPLLYTLFMFNLLKKGHKSTTLLLVTIAFGLLGALLHIL
ncbi:MAG: PTS system mannose/fructose/sorbose family transporter subunit IID [Tepidanaerobacter acetatoxydans]|uniref:PTS system mannose/fructose/sorbose family transporter subunit IID n=1 Tax=Tepidanaerobacter acetatoxydans TaxID=499229 RepID=UPI0026EC4C1F|nr:PTS system mannose/fructose/sorbose family transporter subunit IID [Tepidanaerobacter acetatoxydans]NLU09512.1 PTS system mannose/fructose/sorbose family transporter subunit IID [Tepidanaerobacter acetatoxydans]